MKAGCARTSWKISKGLLLLLLLLPSSSSRSFSLLLLPSSSPSLLRIPIDRISVDLLLGRGGGGEHRPPTPGTFLLLLFSHLRCFLSALLWSRGMSSSSSSSSSPANFSSYFTFSPPFSSPPSSSSSSSSISSFVISFSLFQTLTQCVLLDVLWKILPRTHSALPPSSACDSTKTSSPTSKWHSVFSRLLGTKHACIHFATFSISPYS
mmetsp:Transcript_2308/g.3435  ORF Transcript_2308/g.3435 Transcript_2308/m.3435 type:complete len:208 (-) Transcript_2308:612-1235(-)